VSGAGRGVPRVSPSQGAPPSPPTSNGDPYGDVIPVSDAKFVFRVSGGGSQQLPVAGALLKYLFDSPTSSGLTFIQLPRGLTRGAIKFFYSAGAVGGLVGVRFRFGTFGENPILYPTQPVALSADFSVRGREQIFVSSDISGAYMPFTVPSEAGTLGVWVNEVGVPATPGSFGISDVFADNLSQISLLPNDTANL